MKILARAERKKNVNTFILRKLAKLLVKWVHVWTKKDASFAILRKVAHVFSVVVPVTWAIIAVNAILLSEPCRVFHKVITLEKIQILIHI